MAPRMQSPEKALVVVEQEGHWRRGIGVSGRTGAASGGGALAVAPESAAGIVSKNPMALDGEDAVSDLGQSFNIDVGAAIDLPDCGSGTLPVHDEDLIFIRCALREENSRER